MATETTDLRILTMEIQALSSLIGKTVGRLMQDRLAETGQGISPLQFGVMHVLHRQPHTLSELSKLFVLDPSTLVPIIDGLEERGLVERRKDPTDRRRAPVALTAPGEELLSQIAVTGDDHVLMVALRALGLERASQLRDLLRDLLEALPDGNVALCDMQDHLRRIHALHSATSSSHNS